MFNVNSPFSNISQRLYDPRMTAGASSAAVGDLSRAFNVSTMAKAQPFNRGISQNVGAMRRGQGTYDAQRQFAPLQQQLGDSAANAQWGLGVQRANESSGLQGLSQLFNQNLTQQRQGMTNQYDNFNLLSRFFNLSDLFGI